MSIQDFDRKNIAQFLHNCILFHDAAPEALDMIAGRLEVVRVQKGSPIVLENEISDHVYFIYSGSVEVVKHMHELNQMSRVATLKAGSQFSEFSVLNRASKKASVFAIEDCVLFRLNGETFLEILNAVPAVPKKLVQHLAQMTHHIQTSKLSLSYIRSDQVQLCKKIAQMMPPKLWKAFDAIPVRLENNNLFVAMRDLQNQKFFEYMVSNFKSVQVSLCLINAADFELLEKELTAAYSAQGADFVTGVREAPPPLVGEPHEWLANISLLHNLPAEWYPEIAKHFVFEQFKAGEMIYNKGAASEKVYILQSGLVDVFLPLGSDLIGAHFATLSPGEYFSEVSVLSGRAHILSARASTDVVLATLSREFIEHFLETPLFTIPLARDLAVQFQQMTSATQLQLFDAGKGLHLQELAELLPKSIVSQYEILPLRLTEGELTIGITNPESDTIYSVISRYLHSYRVNLQLITHTDFKKWFELMGSAAAAGAAPQTAKVKKPVANLVRGDAVGLLNKILLYGFENRASDIHFEPAAEHFAVRFRIDGVLREGPDKFAKEAGAEIINRVKIMCHVDTTNRFTPQDGQMKIENVGVPAYARVSTLPAKHGESIVMRLIRERSSVPPLAMLAPDLRVAQIFRNVVKSKQGVFLATGPTGSGKSTTLYSLLQELNRVEVSIISLEDPVEMEIAGTTQVEINEKVGLTFAAALKSALRQDPNVIMIGEIRDEESAKIAFHAASTGHLVISSLHTNDSVNVVPRLLELGVSPGALSSCLIGASAQRLMRQNCSKCKTTRPITESDIEVLRRELGSELQLPSELHYGQGCSGCGQSGYHGRFPALEVWEKTPALETLLLQKYDSDKFYDELANQKFNSIRQFGFKMVLNGLTTIEEVQRALGGTVAVATAKASTSNETVIESPAKVHRDPNSEAA